MFAVINSHSVSAELIRAEDGSLRGIRVRWTWRSDIPIDCVITSPRVELLIGSESRVQKDVNTTSNSTDFLTQLDCNVAYKPRVSAVVSDTRWPYDGGALIYGGSYMAHAVMHDIHLHAFQVIQSNSIVHIDNHYCTGSAGPPSKLQQICVEHLSGDHTRLNISWEPLPCHLQNGANITSYNIRYRLASDSGDRVQTLSSVSKRFDCRQEPGGPYRCLTKILTDSTRLMQNKKYIFQVAVVNNQLNGSYSDPVSATPGGPIHNGKHNIIAGN